MIFTSFPDVQLGTWVWLNTVYQLPIYSAIRYNTLYQMTQTGRKAVLKCFFLTNSINVTVRTGWHCLQKWCMCYSPFPELSDYWEGLCAPGDSSHGILLCFLTSSSSILHASKNKQRLICHIGQCNHVSVRKQVFHPPPIYCDLAIVVHEDRYRICIYVDNNIRIIK